MLLFIKLAWRNVFRNKRRTYIAGAAVGVGLAALIFTDALMIGMVKNMIDSATASFLGQAQIHRESFTLTQDIEKTIAGLDKTVNELKQEPLVKNFSLRALSFAMITSPNDVNSIVMYGIDPDTEKNISEIDDSMKEGAYLDGGSERDIIIGDKLASNLGVALGDKVVLTVSQAKTGELAQELFRISGIYKFGIKELDGGMAFVRLSKAQKMLNIGAGVHEIAIKFQDANTAQDNKSYFWSKFSKDGNVAEGWPKILPELASTLKMTDFSMIIVIFMLFSIVSIGIINTLFMSLYERMFEFGVLRAVGTRPSKVALLIFFEAAALSVVSIIIGSLLGLGITYWISHIGINYNGIEYAGVTFVRKIYPEMNIGQFIYYSLCTIGFTLVAAIYPAVHAARLIPVEAMRKSL